MLKAVLELRMMSLAGYMPDLTACDHCGNFEDAGMFFEKEKGLLVCCKCGSGGRAVTASVLAAMRHICYSDFVKLFNFTLSDEALECLSVLTEAYLKAHIQKNFKTLDFYKSLAQLKL